MWRSLLPNFPISTTCEAAGLPQQTAYRIGGTTASSSLLELRKKVNEDASIMNHQLFFFSKSFINATNASTPSIGKAL